jgi:signal transduction histidine kinase
VRVMSAGRRGSMVLVMSGSPPTARRLRWTASPFADVALALLLGVLSLQSAFGEQDREHLWAFIVLIELAVLPLAVRRSRPLAVLAITLAAAIAGDLLFSSFQLLGPVIALYTVAAHCERRLAMTAAAATAVALVIPAVGEGGVTDAGFGVAMYAVFGAAWALGDNLRTRRAYLAELEARAERLERDREERARRAVAAERARIARELHDVISHNVSVMVVQAAAGADVFATHPERARQALGSIESTGREALVELRRLLGVVSPADQEDRASFAPQPGLGRLPELIEQVTAAGLRVQLTVAGNPRGLPAAVDLSAYRIVQEALTNTLKHAHASRADVALRYGEASIELEVVDDGSGDGTAGRGRGLIGMRERAALFGGELSAGPRPSGGFRVSATMPLGDTAT